MEKADPTLAAEAKSALLGRQFIRGLPSAIRGRLLDHNSTPSLAEMLSFVQRYRAVEHHNPPTSASTTTARPSADVNQLVGLMTELAARQKTLEDQVASSQQLYAAAIKQQDQQSPRATRACYQCGKQGHFARECRNSRQRQNRSNVQCYNCHRYGHFARECGNYAPLNYQGASQETTGQ